MQDGQGQAPKQLLSERIKSATNILVTVSRNPSVDELSAALALTLMLNKLDKHATAVFSGKIPPALQFLNPEKTFEGTVDSLRDFIIALDKEKADRLRYKVEDDVVRIFITPYRTTIGEKDLAFSQGDFNVELIVALGVEKKDDLDAAIAAHGRILHDATVATVNTVDRQSGLGSIDWTDAGASSFCEMLMSLSESLKSGLLDEQIATAILTGIVAATERFSNAKTSPKVMTMAAQLMAAGANQQLIATKLEEGNEISPATPVAPDGSKKLTEGSSEKVNTITEPDAPTEQKPADGEMHVDHEARTDSEQAAEKAEELAESAEELAHKVLPEPPQPPQIPHLPPATPTLSVEDLKKDIAAANEEVEQAVSESESKVSSEASTSDWKTPESSEVSEPSNNPQAEPLFGGTLNATTDEAHEAKVREDRLSRNHKLLSHDGPSTPQAPLNSVSPGADNDEPPTVDPFAEPPRSDPTSPMHYEAIMTKGPTIQPLPVLPPLPAEQPAPTPAPQEPATPFSPAASPASSGPTLSELEAQAHGATASPVNDARAAVNAALEALPFNPASEPLAASGAQPLSTTPLNPPTQDIPTPPPLVSSTPLPPPPPLPDFSTLPPLPNDQPAASPAPVMADPSFSPSAAPQFEQPAPASTDPGQFKLPGQS